MSGIVRVGWPDEKYNEEPYFFISKRDGSFVSTLNIKMPVRYSSWFRTVEEVDGYVLSQKFGADIPNNRYYGSDFLIADISSDTIFRFIKERDLTPFVVRTPSVHSTEPRRVWSLLLTTDTFIFLQEVTLYFKNETLRYKNLMYEFRTGETSEVLFISDDFPSRKWEPNSNICTPINMAASLISAERLRGAYEEKKLKGALEQLTATLKEDDNPVLMLVKFKSSHY